MARRTLEMMTKDDFDDIPDDYIQRKVSWLWSVLPGRDAFRFIKLIVKGYTPTWGEAINGVADAASTIFFVYSAGSQIIDCTGAVIEAIGDESFGGLAKALGIIGKKTVGIVLQRFISALSNPKNYIRLALVGGYFAYDAFLRHTDMNIPNKAELLEINEKYLSPIVKRELAKLIYTVGNEVAFGNVNLSEFEKTGNFTKDQKIQIAVNKLKTGIHKALNKLLTMNEQRRRILRFVFEFIDVNKPLWAPKDNQRMLMMKNFAKNIPTGKFYMKRKGTVISDLLRLNRLIVQKSGLQITSLLKNRIKIPTNAEEFKKFIKNPRFISFALEEILNLIP